MKTEDIMKPIQCPNCGALETEPTFDGGMYCHHCERFFTVEEQTEGTDAPIRYPLPGEGKVSWGTE